MFNFNFKTFQKNNQGILSQHKSAHWFIGALGHSSTGPFDQWNTSALIHQLVLCFLIFGKVEKQFGWMEMDIDNGDSHTEKQMDRWIDLPMDRWT